MKDISTLNRDFYRSNKNAGKVKVYELDGAWILLAELTDDRLTIAELCFENYEESRAWKEKYSCPSGHQMPDWCPSGHQMPDWFMSVGQDITDSVFADHQGGEK